jgi:ankyrin repeat protein
MGDENEGRKPSLAKLLKYGADPNSLSFEDSGQRRTLLCLAVEEAAQTEDFSKVELLLDHRADPNRRSETGASPLSLAVKRSHMQLSRQLLQAKSDVNQQDAKLVTPLHTAVFQNDSRVVQLLLMYKANVNTADRLGQSPVFFASSREVCCSLISAEADLLHLNKKGQSALHTTAHSGSYEALAYLVEQGSGSISALVDLQDENGRTALHHAAVKGHQDCVSRLMDVGADAHAKTKTGHTAMSLAEPKHLDLAYYIYTRTTGGNKSTWRESAQNPVFLTTAAILGVACFVNRQLLWEFTWDLIDLARSR